MKKLISFSLVAFLLGVGITGLVVYLQEPSGDKQNDFYRESKSIDKEYNWISLPDFNEDETVYELSSLTSEVPNTLDLSKYSNSEVIIEGNDVSGQDSYELSTDSINENNEIQIKIDEKDYFIKTLPKYLSDYDYENNGAQEGYYYFSYGDYIVKLSTEGEIVYYKDVGRSYDFKANKSDNGEIYYTYLEHINPQEKVDDVGYHPTKAVIMDDEYKVVDEIESIIETDKVNSFPLENHDFTFIDKNHYIVSAYYRERVDNIPVDLESNEYGTRVVTPYLQEIKDNEVVWEWKGSEYPELYNISVEHNDFSNEHTFFSDYAHFNSMFIDPDDNNLLLSMRNLDTILKVSRENGEIMWYLGGENDEFGLSADQKFRRQHKATKLADGSIMLFNNGNILPAAKYPVIEEDDPLHEMTPRTTIMKFDIDEENKTLEEFRNLETEYFSGTRGSAQETKSGSVVIGWGSGEDNKEHFREVDFETGEAFFVFYPHDEDIISYRAYKYSY